MGRMRRRLSMAIWAHAGLSVCLYIAAAVCTAHAGWDDE